MKDFQWQKKHLWRSLVVIFGLLVFLDGLSYLAAEGLWFQEVGYFQAFQLRVLTQVGLGLSVTGISLWFLWRNLAIAFRNAWSDTSAETARSSLPGQLRLVWLLPLALCLSLILGVMLLYYGQIAAEHWHPHLDLYNVTAKIPIKFRPQSLWQIGQSLAANLWQTGLLAALILALLIYPRWLLGAIALLLSLSFGLVLSEHWAQVLAALHATSFGRADPVFGRDTSYFVFLLPLLELLEFWLIGLVVLSVLSVGLIYLLSGNSLSRGRFPGFSSLQLRHLYGVGSCLMLMFSFSHWLDRYELLYSQTGVAYGASYTNLTAELPGYTVLSLVALAIGILLLSRTVFWQADKDKVMPRYADVERYGWKVKKRAGAPSSQAEQQSPISRYQNADGSFSEALTPRVPSFVSVAQAPFLNLRLLPFAIGVYLFILVLVTMILPPVVQRMLVQPNELELERPYIERAIALTREAFNLETIDIESFNPQYTLDAASIERNALTVNSIRLWDTRPLLETNRQLQRIRLYYEFPDADVDRYSLPNKEGGTAQQQVLIAAREMDYSAVPKEAQTWVNQHLIYTHGYGFTVSPVNTAGEGGLPNYYVQGIEQTFSDERLRGVIPTDNPRIYYGELTNNYVMTQTELRELDYPSGDDNVYNSYNGQGGVTIGSFWRRLVYAKHLGDWRMLLTENFTPETRLLIRRRIDERVREIAPFLRYDNDPYLVAADANPQQQNTAELESAAASPRLSSSNQPTPSYLYWIIDAYTTSDRYPYSDPGGNDFNYIRNSVKVVIDAYNGSVSFYMVDEQDPLTQTWNRVFPNLLQPLSQMPAALRKHIRYPQDFYRVQSDQLMAYHMTDPQVFYNREDQWRAPNEIYADVPQLVEPYYLIMKLPEESNEEFILFRPYTPNQRTNLIGWLAARSDGENYGKMLLYRFSKQELVYGPEQLEARINQDPVISQQISLWNRRGSRAIQGNLLVIPMERSLLYVEPLYIEAEQNRLPTLARIIVAYGDRIVMAETLQQGLDAIFQPTANPSETPIVRPLAGEGVPP